jgi:hypothetical protein
MKFLHTYYRLPATCVLTCISAPALNETGLCKYKGKDIISIHQGCPLYDVALKFTPLYGNIQKKHSKNLTYTEDVLSTKLVW